MCVCTGAGLRMGVQAAANAAAQSLEAHRAAVQAELAHAQTQLLSAAHTGKQQTGDGEPSASCTALPVNLSVSSMAFFAV